MPDLSPALHAGPNEWRAPDHWRVIDFVSDLHLQSGEPATWQAFERYLKRAPAPDALFVLGDLFEVWIGDDALDQGASAPGDAEPPFWRACAAALRRFSAHTALFFMAGNRDFLLGPDGLREMGMQALPDPTVLVWRGQRYLLSHGDAWCVADTDYQRFRQQVRTAVWQQDFLARPLAERQAVARQLRAQSEARKRQLGPDPSLWADLDDATVRQQLQAASADILIHGHTHRPAEHSLGQGLRRLVLSDWDATARPARLQVLRLSGQGLERLDLPAV
jgi:UDP-2,3-diacylglucosamine hydrolase